MGMDKGCTRRTQLEPDTEHGMSKYTVNVEPVDSGDWLKFRNNVVALDAAMDAPEKDVTVCGLLPFPLMVAMMLVVVPNPIFWRCAPLLLSQVKSTRRILMVAAWLLVRLI